MGDTGIVDKDSDRSEFCGNIFDEGFNGIVVIDQQFFTAALIAFFSNVVADGFCTAIAGGRANDGSTRLGKRI